MAGFDYGSESELTEWQVEEIRKGLAEADRGEFASESEVQQTIRKWKRPGKL